MPFRFREIRNKIACDLERISLASAAKWLGRKGLQEVAQIVRPGTILGWQRRLIAKRFDGSKNRSLGKGGCVTSDKIEELFLQLAKGEIAVGDIGGLTIFVLN